MYLCSIVVGIAIHNPIIAFLLILLTKHFSACLVVRVSVYKLKTLISVPQYNGRSTRRLSCSRAFWFFCRLFFLWLGFNCRCFCVIYIDWHVVSINRIQIEVERSSRAWWCGFFVLEIFDSVMFLLNSITIWIIKNYRLYGV